MNSSILNYFKFFCKDRDFGRMQCERGGGVIGLLAVNSVALQFD